MKISTKDRGKKVQFYQTDIEKQANCAGGPGKKANFAKASEKHDKGSCTKREFRLTIAEITRILSNDRRKNANFIKSLRLARISSKGQGKKSVNKKRYSAKEPQKNVNLVRESQNMEI